MGMSEALIGFLGVVVGLAVASARRGSPTELAALSRSLDSLTVLLSGGGARARLVSSCDNRSP